MFRLGLIWMGWNHWKMEITDTGKNKCIIEFWDQANYWGLPCDYTPTGPFKWRNKTPGSMTIPNVDLAKSSPTMNGDSHGYDVFGGLFGAKFGKDSGSNINVKFFVPDGVSPVVIFECFDLLTTNVLNLVKEKGSGRIFPAAAAKMRGGSMNWRLLPTGINN